jgi:hypothetical protein
MKRTTKINGMELDLRGININIEHISPDEYRITVGSDKCKFDSRLTNIIDAFRSIFNNVHEKVEQV